MNWLDITDGDIRRHDIAHTIAVIIITRELVWSGHSALHGRVLASFGDGFSLALTCPLGLWLIGVVTYWWQIIRASYGFGFTLGTVIRAWDDDTLCLTSSTVVTGSSRFRRLDWFGMGLSLDLRLL